MGINTLPLMVDQWAMPIAYNNKVKDDASRCNIALNSDKNKCWIWIWKLQKSRDQQLPFDVAKT